ncbi:MAG: hypothetical protein A4E28_00825 [Methanocella sp. PtaU1.Bin125]|nr:MAG: hypothetical protein A4E28_00825 [Methanocella sp. PtaU1.Bin125]
MEGAFIRRSGARFCVAAIAVYVICTLVSALFMTKPFDPLGNWIGDLGNSAFNPQGAIIYNGGVILTGLLLAPFMLSLAHWHIGPQWSRRMLTAAEAAGIALCLGMVLLGLFPETAGGLHLHLSEFVYAAITVLIILVNVALYRNVRYRLWVIPVLGFASFLLNCFLIGLYLANVRPAMFTVYLWMSVYLAFFWIFLFCYNALATRAPDLMDTTHGLL